jgi:plasmid stabilization system protein ParE
MSGYALHPLALADLNEIWDYIAEQNLDAADRVIGEIFAKLDILSSSPRIGHQRPELSGRPLRFAVVREYLIAYAPDESPVLVIAVIHGRRNPRIMASILHGRSEEPV